MKPIFIFVKDTSQKGDFMGDEKNLVQEYPSHIPMGLSFPDDFEGFSKERAKEKAKVEQNDD